MNLIQRKIMAFRNLFKDNNDINEKKYHWIYIIFNNGNICCY